MPDYTLLLFSDCQGMSVTFFTDDQHVLLTLSLHDRFPFEVQLDLLASAFDFGSLLQNSVQSHQIFFCFWNKSHILEKDCLCPTKNYAAESSTVP
jgi:hypothetical protein